MDRSQRSPRNIMNCAVLQIVVEPGNRLGRLTLAGVLVSCKLFLTWRTNEAWNGCSIADRLANDDAERRPRVARRRPAGIDPTIRKTESRGADDRRYSHAARLLCGVEREFQHEHEPDRHRIDKL